MSGIIIRVEPRQGWSLVKMGRTYWWVAIARNGEIVAQSEVYTTPEKRDQTGTQVAAQLEVRYTARSTSSLNNPTESF